MSGAPDLARRSGAGGDNAPGALHGDDERVQRELAPAAGLQPILPVDAPRRNPRRRGFVSAGIAGLGVFVLLALQPERSDPLPGPAADTASDVTARPAVDTALPDLPPAPPLASASSVAARGAAMAGTRRTPAGVRLHEPAQSEPGPVAAYAPPADASTSGSAARAGRLWVSSRPWGLLMVDGQFVGHTPAANVPLTAGAHAVSIVRDGFQPFQQHIQVAPGDTVRLVDIVLLAAAR